MAKDKESGIFVELYGKRYSISEVARLFGISSTTLSRRLQRGIDLKDAIRKDAPPSKPKEKKPEKKAVRAKASKPRAAKPKTKARSRKPKKALKTVSYQGAEYTVESLAKLHGMAPETLRYRIVKKGLSPEEAVNPERLVKKITASTGEARTINEWAEITGIKAMTIRGRLYAGRTPDEALGMVSVPRSDNSNEADRRSKKIDWQGKKWTRTELAAAYGHSRETLYMRLKKGWSLEEALLTPTGDSGERLTASNGQSMTVTAWAKLTGKTVSTLWYRQREGWTVDQIVGLEPPPKPTRKHWVVEWNGQKCTARDLARMHGLSLSTVADRLRRGLSPEEAVSSERRNSPGRTLRPKCTE